MTKRNFALAIAALACAQTPAHALPLGAYWEPVPNAINPVTSEPSGLEGDWLTFDLYLALDTGDVASAFDFGIAGPNTGLITDGAFYQTESPFGSDSAIENIANGADHPALPFDTAVAMNEEPLLFAQAMDWDQSGVTGAWFSSLLGQVAGPVWLARITVSSDTTFLGGQFFVSGSGPSGDWGCGLLNDSCILDTPNAIPTPGAAAVFAMTLLQISRRNRPQEEPR